jgi:pimeloyl-ACP methyl ester carboxylesterase
MSEVTSKDGTTIAFERQGHGPAVILATGALDDGSENASLATELAGRFTVYNYARRGRGSSGDTPPYALEREIEDLEALITEAGGTAHLYGVSSGGALALAAAAAGLAAQRIAVYEVPYFVDDDLTASWRAYVGQLGSVLADGRPGDALALFHRLTGFSDDDIARVRTSPHWLAAQALEHTLAYDAACLGDGAPPTRRLASIVNPTLVATGGGQPFLEGAADAIAAAVPHAERVVLQGRGHVVDAGAMATELTRFFGA